MSRPVAIVTDSTSDIPEELRAAHGIAVVPLLVRFGDETFRDGVNLSAAEFLTRLRESNVTPKTSQPAVPDFEAVFREALARDQDVVCVTISAGLSGTYNAARLAADAVDAERIRVVDSGAVTMQLGFAVLEAAKAAEGDAGLDGVEAVTRNALERSRLFAVLKTLDYLYQGGRIGKVSQIFGSALAIKPILHLGEGIVVPLERVRTWNRALDRVCTLVQEQGPLSDLAVLHCDNEADAQKLVDRLAHLVDPSRVVVTHAGPVISTYAGPGAIGVALLRAEAWAEREKNRP
jgi:DegV family protein with EDD domain